MKQEKEQKRVDKILSQFQRPLFFVITKREKRNIFENLSLMVTSGVSFESALQSLLEEFRSGAINRMLESMMNELQEGSKISEIFQKHKILPAYMLAIIKIGEESGRLNENLEIVVEYIRREEDFNSRIRSASLYPVTVFFTLLVIATGVGLFVLPSLASTYSNLKLDLPMLTRVLIKVGTFLGEHGFVAVPIFLVSVFLIFYVIFIFSKTKFIGQFILLKLPGIGKLIRGLEIARFGYLLSVLLGAGVHILDGFKLLSSATEYRSYRRSYKLITEGIDNGKSFQETFEANSYIGKNIPAYTRQMIISAEQSGTLQEAFSKISENYTRKSDYSSKNLTVLIEPILLIIVWVGVAVLAFAVVLPVYTLTSSLSEQGNNSVSNNSSTNDQEKTLTITKVQEGDLDALEHPENYNPLEDIQFTTTGQGYLNIRSSIGGSVIDQILTGETYKFTEERNGWYRIVLKDGTTGWVNGSFVSINE